MWLWLLMPWPLIGPFIFRDLVYHYWLVDPDEFLYVGLILQELQTIAMMLHRMAFHLSGKVGTLHLDNSTAKAYLHNQSGTVSPCFSRLTWQILSLIEKHDITLIPAYIPTHLNVEDNYLSQGQMLPEWHLLPQITQAAFTFGVY